jgi:hypothetical protein
MYYIHIIDVTEACHDMGCVAIVIDCIYTYHVMIQQLRDNVGISTAACCHEGCHTIFILDIYESSRIKCDLSHLQAQQRAPDTRIILYIHVHFIVFQELADNVQIRIRCC